MLLQSHFKELNLSFYDINLDNHKKEEVVKNTSVNIQKDGYSIKSELFHSKNFCIINTDRFNEKDLTEFVDITGEYVLIAYLLSGNVAVKYIENSKNVVDYGKLQITCGNLIKNKVTVTALQKTESILIYVKMPFFLNLIKREPWSHKNDIFKYINNKHLNNSFVTSLIADHELHVILKSIIDYYKKGNNSSYYLDLKIRELLLKIQHTNFETAKEKNVHVHKIKDAKEYIEKNYLKTPTIKEISRHILLNEMQLKNGFRDVFGITIRSYVIELKMKKAVTLLKNHPVNEVTHLLGYRSVSHFISIYKNYYGRTPSSKKLN
ncbi:helix-turn-helix transcriptional regulator [Wenyingzhuangia sp. IMCC45467]